MMRLALLASLSFLALACDKPSTTVASAPAAVAAPTPATPPTPPARHIEESCATICNKNISCGGLTGDAARTATTECMGVCIKQGAGDPMAGPVVATAMAQVADKCSKVACDKFGDCYMDTLKDVQTQLVGPTPAAPPVSAATKKHFVDLVCKVVNETPGHVPDLNTPTPSANMRELKLLVGEMAQEQGGVNELADLMKDAIASCNAAPAPR